ncbi:MAG: T9SS type A sorting domain-containing protein [Candidatus Delongbacteria bacterium]|jgi:hypothetical protein|nr:T9SS type A sorting domain-containing protein [Candidatus Delongbacteria bacterium]
MKKHALTLILIISLSLLAQWDWSVPLQISEYGNYPETWYSYPAITIDNNGKLHAFWIKGIQINDDLNWYNQIEYSSSNNSGISWSTPENITPEYTNDRIDDISAVCDSKNNIHLFYQRGYYPDDLYYKRYDRTSWTEPYLIDSLVSTNLRVGIDRTDTITLSWFIGETTYFTSCDLNNAEPNWSTVSSVTTINCSVYSQFAYDKNNNLYTTGINRANSHPYLFKFEKSSSNWSFEEILPYEAYPYALTLSDSNTLIVNLSIGPTIDDNINYISSRSTNSTMWSELLYVNDDNDRYREMFIDSSNVIHLFEMHYGSKPCLSYTSNLGIWTTDLFRMDTFYSYGNFDVCFDKIDNFYITYTEGNPDTHSGAVFFQTKKIDTGIEDNEEFTISDYELEQNYPNPFNPMTTIEFAIPHDQNVNLSIYNSKGELVGNLLDRKLQRGKHKVTYYAKDLKSGVYFYTLKTEEKKITKKMIFVK